MQDYSNLFNIRPLPVKLCSIEYSVNEDEEAFRSIALQFSNQKFEQWEVNSNNTKPQNDDQDKYICQVMLRKPTKYIKIKQRNTLEGVSKICGLWLVAKDGSDNAKIDLCEGKG